MKFSTPIIATLSLLSSANALPASFGQSPVDGNSLFKRATANICASITLGLPVPEVLGVCPIPTTNGQCVAGIGANVCLCLANGKLTDASFDLINSLVNDFPLLSVIEPVLGGLENIISSVENLAAQILGSDTTNCVYPEGAIPDSCSSCAFDCPTGEQVCGDACISDEDACSSGAPQRRKRDFLSGPDVLCHNGWTACGIPSSPLFTGRNFECIDTATDLESCGACAFPLPGQPMGVDCTAIQHTLGVTCLSGKCVVDSCERGFELNEDASGCVPLAKSAISEKKRRAKEMIKKRQVNVQALKAKSANKKRGSKLAGLLRW